jgi:hypothetical protein
MRIKDSFFIGGFFKVGDGKNVRFLEDIWLGERPLSQQYASLYNIVQHKDVWVEDVLTQTCLNITFRRGLTSNKWTV